MRIGLLPLDERPVNTRYPAMIGAIAGVEVIVPPLEILSHFREPAQPDVLADWLRENVLGLDVLIVSLEMLGMGGLIASRITDDDASVVLNRLNVLRELKQQNPALQIYGFNVITRIPAYNFNVEEPLYWGDHGLDIHMFSQYFDRELRGEDVSAELDKLWVRLPPQHLADFFTRRLRNHIVNLAALGMANQGEVFETLVISSDDTSEYGVGTREKTWLSEWNARLRTFGGTAGRVLMYPGADEVGCVLLARTLAVEPQVAVHYAIPEDALVIAPYEDGAVSVTVERQIHAVGGEITDSKGARFILAINTPSRIRREFDPAQAESERAHRTPYLQRFVEQIKAWVETGKWVIVADVAYPNGADPVLIDLLREGVDLSRLAAYGAWNTAGNTIGTALAQGIAASQSKTDEQREAQGRFLVHRFVEDWAYQHLVREEARDWLEAQTGQRDPVPEQLEATRAFIEEWLQKQLAELPVFGEQWQIVPGSVRLPWNRTFEVDFDLERRA